MHFLFVSGLMNKLGCIYNTALFYFVSQSHSDVNLLYCRNTKELMGSVRHKRFDREDLDPILMYLWSLLSSGTTGMG